MEVEQFDQFTRRLSDGGSSRRQVIRTLGRVLLGSALGGAAARLGLVAGAEAKAKRKQKAQPKRKARGQLQAEGKRKGKGKGKGKKPHRNPPPPLPLGCEACNACQMCQDGACVPDPALNGVRCLGSGAACGYCRGGQCAASAIPPCPDGTCPQSVQCCSGEKRCVDAESATGYSCLGESDCCPDQRKCAGGCIFKQACCPEQRPSCGQYGEVCVNGTWQCSAEKPCANGSCVAHDECCPEEWTCADGSCVAQNQCCADERRCPDGSCRSINQCSNGCRLNASCDGCDEPPPGKEFCPGQNRCIEACPSGKVMNLITCACECPPGSALLTDGVTCCPQGRYCRFDGAGRPMFCCAEDQLCVGGGVCCPAALRHESLCHTDKCPCLICRLGIPETCL